MWGMDYIKQIMIQIMIMLCYTYAWFYYAIIFTVSLQKNCSVPIKMEHLVYVWTSQIIENK